MKIKSLNISAFGGIKNLQLSFFDGFNVVYGNNENGKTTVMNFIKMMFYGTERSSSQIFKNLRKKYTPWDGGQMAGSIDFETKNRNYRIERIFGSSNSSDKVTLIDLDLGTRETVSPDIGTKLFGLSCGAFERSIFIGQFGFPESNSSAEGEINSKLSNLTSTGDQAVSFDEVNSRLQTAKFSLMSKSGRAGIYDKNLNSAKELKAKIDSAEQTKLSLEAKKQTAENLAAKIKEMQAKAENIKTQIDKEQDFRNAEKLKELLSLKEKLDELNATLKLNNGQTADEMFVRKVEFCLSKIEGIESKISAKLNENKIIKQNLQMATNPSPDATPEKLKQLTEKLESLEREKDQTEKRITELSKKSKAKTNPVWLILAVVFAVIAASLFIAKSAVFGALSVAVSVGFAVIFLLNSLKTNKENQQTENTLVDLKFKLNQLISVISSEKSNITAINTAINSNSGIIQKQKEMLKTNNNDLEILEKEKQIETETLFELFARYKAVNDIEEIKQELKIITEKAVIQKEIKQNINYILKDVGNISYDEAREKLEKVNTRFETVEDFQKMKEDYEQLLSNITEQKTALASLLTETKSLSNSISNIETNKKQLESLKLKIQNQKEYCDCLDIALSVLADSFIEVRRSFGSLLERNAGRIFKGITGEKYNGMTISKSFQIAVEKSDIFGTKEIDYLSSGTADQAYLSLRLALCELMAGDNERFPVLLDDSLAQYDDQRTQTALNFLNEYAKNSQIIMFTCHNSVNTASKQSGAREIVL